MGDWENTQPYIMCRFLWLRGTVRKILVQLGVIQRQNLQNLLEFYRVAKLNGKL